MKLSITNVLLPSAVFGASPSVAKNVGFTEDFPSRVRAMTQNLYLGANLGRLANPDEPCFAALGATAGIPCVASELWNDFLFADFPSRAEVIAGHIEMAMPDVIGLQEVTTALTGPFDLGVVATGPVAEDVVQDFLQILLEKLESKNLKYDALLGSLVNDNELPAYNDPYDPTSGGFNVRLKTYGAMLLKQDTVAWSNNDTLTFEAQPDVGLSYSLQAADVTIRGITYRAVNAHLSPSSPRNTQSIQAKETIAYLENETKPTIFVTDLNSWPEQEADQATPYEVVTSDGGFADVWMINENPDAGDGLTWGHNATLTNEEVNFTLRIDHIFYRGMPEMRAWARTFGDDPADSKTSDGKRWASDHASVFADMVPSAPTKAPSVLEETDSPSAVPTSPPADGSGGEVALRTTAAAFFVTAVVICVGSGLSIL